MKLFILKEVREKVMPEQEVYFNFKYGGRGEVMICVCDRDGTPLTCGNLLGFYADGTIRKMGGVNSKLGFQLDEGGHIQES